MFQPVADIVSWRDLFAPAPSYSSEFSQWKEDVDEYVEEIIADVEVNRDEFDVVKLITYRALEKFVAKATAVGWAAQTADERRYIAEQGLNRPQIPQRTPAWYAQGKQVLTASEFAKLLGSPRSVSQLVQSKVPSANPSTQTNRLACMTCEMGPFDWGIRFEPVVKQILEAKWGVKIAEAGRILHPTDTHIAASPDGIILEATDPARVGRLLEIKCPVSRVIGEGIPFDYWCQMQVQLEVTGIDECEYVEVKLESIQGVNTDLSGTPDGCLWLLQNHTTFVMQYAYTPAELSGLLGEGYELIETIPWRLSKMYAVTVTRDRAWFQSTGEAREKFWQQVEEARSAPSPRVIVTKEPACMIVG
jgi:hypothetical protein